MKHYYKEITKQDVTRSFVVNRFAVLHFFGSALTAHGDEDGIFLRKCGDENYDFTRLVLHQDTRLLIKSRFFDIGDVIYFKKIDFNHFEYTIFKENFEKDKIISFFNKKKYYLSEININLYDHH